MLPKQLSEVQKRLNAKGYNARSNEEDELLAELNAIDNLSQSDYGIRKIANDSMTETRATSGPSGQCPCCGR
jgi:hypothetical protein